MPETKEKNNEISQINIDREIKIVDVGKESINKEPIPREIKTWLEKVEQSSASQQTTVNDNDGQSILTPINPSPSTTDLPISKNVFARGFKKTWYDAGRWLSVFVWRFMKIKGGKIKFKDDID